MKRYHKVSDNTRGNLSIGGNDDFPKCYNPVAISPRSGAEGLRAKAAPRRLPPRCEAERGFCGGG